MSWAAQRRFIILLIIGAVIVAFLTAASIATFYKAPSCSDGKQNQEEVGVDCGGPCTYLCTEQKLPPTVLFTKAIQNREGRIDVIAKVENKNFDAAAKNVPYRITLYGANQALIQQISGTLDLPPAGSVPVFVPGVASGKQTVANAFLDITPSSPRWFTLTLDPRVIPEVSNTALSGTISAPRVTAVLANPSINALTNVKVIVLVQNDKRNVIAASATVVPAIPAQGKSAAIFTWNEPFSSTPASIEVVPMIPLP